MERLVTVAGVVVNERMDDAKGTKLKMNDIKTQLSEQAKYVSQPA